LDLQLLLEWAWIHACNKHKACWIGNGSLGA
jgi:hypothetical protein